MKNWWVLALGVVFGLLGAGIIFLSSQPPRGNAIALLPPPTPIPIQVHISGEIQNPGVYALPVNSRVQDIIEAAGGFTENANSTSLNLAAQLEDGMRVQVPAQIRDEAPSPTAATSTKDAETPPQPISPPADAP